MIQVVATDAEEPYHVVITSSGNNQTLLTGENLHNAGDAVNQIVAVAEEFGVIEPNVFEEGEYYALRSGEHVVNQIQFIDQRS
jgi:hypothetical protein